MVKWWARNSQFWKSPILSKEYSRAIPRKQILDHFWQPCLYLKMPNDSLVKTYGAWLDKANYLLPLGPIYISRLIHNANKMQLYLCDHMKCYVQVFNLNSTAIKYGMYYVKYGNKLNTFFKKRKKSVKYEIIK